MEIPPGRPLGLRLPSSLVVGLIGLSTIAGWALDIEVLKSIIPGFVAMKANTAACLLVAALALALPRTPRGRRASAGLAAGVLAVALVTASEYPLGWDSGLDELFFRDPSSLSLGHPPGRMALATSFAFALTATALILAACRRAPVLAQCLTLAAILIPVFSLLSYLFGERSITLRSPYTSLAVNTAVAFAFLGAGILSDRTEAGPMALFFAGGPGGTSLRRLLPLSITSTLLLGFASFLGARAGLYSFASGMVMFAVVTSVALTAAIWANGWHMERMEEARGLERDRLRMTLTSIGDAVIATDREGRIQFLNPVAERLTGWASGEAAGLPLGTVFRIVNETTRAEVEDPVAKVLATGNVVGLANHTILIARDGSECPIEDSAAAIRGARGAILGVVLVFHDVTDRRRDEEALRDARARLDAALDAGAIATWTWDIPRDRVVADANLARLFSVSPEDAAGGPLASYLKAIHPDDLARVSRAIGDSMAGGEPYDEEYRITRPGGPTRWVVARGKVVRDGEGRPLTLSGLAVDITGRKEAEQRVRESEERYRTLFTSMDEGFCVIEMIGDPAGTPADYRFLEVNPAFEKHTGLRDSLGRTIRELAPEIEDHWFETYGAVAGTGEPARSVYKSSALEDRWFEVSAFRIGDPRERKVAVLFNDISGRKRAEDDRERLVDQLREADRLKDEFLAMLAHELRNPLAAIANAVGVTTRDASRENHDWAMEVITRQMRHLTRLIEDLMDVSRISRGKIELRKDVLDATAILDSAAVTVTPLVQERKHTLDLEIDRGNLWVEVDPTRLEQVTVNLLNNAAKYSENGGQIRLVARRDDGEVVITVKDRGVGIPPEKLPGMFELFAQGDRSLARSEGGLGIGLTVVKKLVEMHGGTIAARSEGAGKGSEFSIRLPAATRPATSGANGSGPTPTAGPSSRVLVVDDNMDTARGMARLLKLAGHEVATAHDGPSALRLAAEFGPEVILLDIGLPGMDGYEVAARLRRDDAFKGALVIAASGYGQEDDLRRSRAAGFDHHLTKPLDYDALLGLIAGRQAVGAAETRG